MHPVTRVIIVCIFCIILLRIGHYMTSSAHQPAQSTICCVAGKSGGHIIPCLTLAQQYMQQNPDTKLLFFSSNYPLDYSLLAHNQMVTSHIPLSLESRGPRIFGYPVRIWQLLHAWSISLYQLYRQNPSVVITTGGIVGVPVCLAAWMLRIPIELYNLDAVPGKAALWLAPIARTIHVCFAQTKESFSKYQCIVSDYPVRFTPDEHHISRSEACKQLGLDEHKKTLLIIGGSQGSVQINSSIKQLFKTHTMKNLQIIHQTGRSDDTDWHEFYTSHTVPAYTFAYRDSLVPCYAAADLIITRAGAGSLFEIAFFKKPSIVIPLEADTTDHQVDNAYAIAQQLPTLFTVIRQKDIEQDPGVLHALIKDTLKL